MQEAKMPDYARFCAHPLLTDALLCTSLMLCRRKFAVFLRRFPSIKTDVVGLLDEWAARFFEELDYVREGNNATKFAQQMEKDLPQVCFALWANDKTTTRHK